jgi:transposase-like protein
VNTDGAPGLISAVEQVWGKSPRQRCLAHVPALAGGARKMRNTVDKVSPAAREEIKHRVQDVFYAPSLETAQERAAQVLRDYQKEHPAAVRSFDDDLQACFVYLRCPLHITRRFGLPTCWSVPFRNAGGAPRSSRTSSPKRRSSNWSSRHCRRPVSAGARHR